MKEPRTITSTFSIFDTGRRYTGKQRGYLLDNVSKVINSAAVRERLRLRQLQGYFGHTMRELAGKLSLTSKNVLTLPNGQQIVADAVPGCVTTDLQIDSKGNVTHVQEVLDNDEGNKIWGLHKNRVGGFSWAASGGASGGNTVLSDLFGFDYVPDPLNANNRGWVMDSNDEAPCREDLLKGLKTEGVDKAGTVLDSWYASMSLANERYQEKNREYELMLLDSESERNDLQLLTDSLELQVEQANSARKSLKAHYEDQIQQINDSHNSIVNELNEAHRNERARLLVDRRATLETLQEKSPVNIPDFVLDALVAPESDDNQLLISEFLQSVAGINAGILPVGLSPKAEYVKGRVFDSADNNDCGSIGVIPDMSM